MKLYEHQEKALEALKPTGGYLAFEQGLGKTLTAIRYAQRTGAKRIVVICPAVAIGVWVDEISRGNGKVEVPRGSRADKARWIADAASDVGRGEAPQWLVLNYEALLHAPLERALARYGADLIVLDEAQKIKTATAKRSKAVHRLSKETATLALSGTPVTKNLLDLYSQYKAIDADIWGGISWTRFKQRYGVWGGYGGYELIGYQNEEELLDKIRPLTVAARKEDTLDLPPKTFSIVPVELSGPDWSAYRQMATTGVYEDWAATTPLEKALRLSQLAGRAKAQATAQQVELLREGGEQVVVFARFRDELESLEDALGVPALSGDTPSSERTAMVDAFQNGELPVFLSQITAGSTAITLTAASHMVYHSLSFAYEDWAQSQDRIHRIGQDDHCFYYYMTARGPKGGITIDDVVLNTLERKEDVAALVTANPDILLPND